MTAYGSIPFDSHIGAGLVAILLLTRSRPGPRLVFHYPPNPKRNVHVTKDDPSLFDSDSEEEDDTTESKISKERMTQEAKRQDSTKPDKVVAGNGDTLLGHSIETLEKLLSPGRWSDGKKFEICLNGLTFIGHPVYAREDGKWSTSISGPTDKDTKHPSNDEDETGMWNRKTTSFRERSLREFSHIPESLDSYLDPSLGTSVDSNSTTSGHLGEQLSMFHVVFAVASQQSDSTDEVFAIYNDEARRLSKALHHCQKEYHYVTNETRKLNATRAKAKQQPIDDEELWKRMTETSELAWALQEIFNQTVRGGIAGIRLHGMEMALQLKARNNAGLHGTTYDSKDLSPLSALLLLETKESILADLSHKDSASLVAFIRELKPTKNLLKHAINLGQPIEDIMYLAHHLVKWRKARLLRMPLHQRNTYVINPGAPLENIERLITEYERTFPGHLPSLPSMLRVLGGRPIKFGQIPPSRDHRGVYMDILAFLVKEGFVCQLMTHGWLKIRTDFEAQSHLDHSDGAEKLRPLSIVSLLSPQIRAATEDDETVSVSSERTALPAGVVPSRPQTATRKSLNRLSLTTQSTLAPPSSQDDDPDNTSSSTILILHPSDPSSKELRLISKVKHSLQNDDTRELFERILPQLDGDHSFEEMAARTGHKRARVEECLDELRDLGVLLQTRFMEGD